MSEYYDVPADIIADVRARSAKINDIIQSIEDGFNALPTALQNTQDEVVAARDGDSDLLTQIQRAQTTTAEVEAARDGEASLLVKEQVQDTAIAALAVANGPLAEYLTERFVLLDGLTASTSATVLQVQVDDSYAFFTALAF